MLDPAAGHNPVRGGIASFLRICSATQMKVESQLHFVQGVAGSLAKSINLLQCKPKGPQLLASNEELHETASYGPHSGVRNHALTPFFLAT
jgi:hypothetical protein